MKTVFKKCTAIALAIACLGGVGTVAFIGDTAPVGITANATQGESPVLGDICNPGKFTKELRTINGNGVSTFKAYRSGLKVTKIVIKNTSGKTLSTKEACVSTLIKKWTNSAKSNTYAQISFKSNGVNIVHVYYNDGNSQTIRVEANKYTYSYKDSGFASNFGLVNHGLAAVKQKWWFEYGGTKIGSVDCASLIYTYRNVGGRIKMDFLGNTKAEGLKWGYVKNGIPRVHGLGLHKPCHAAIYAGNGNTIEARSYTDYCVKKYYNSASNFNEWFYIVGVKYPVTGWVKIDGKPYYYQNGQYLVNCTKKINGVTYKFASNGVANKNPAESAYSKTQYKVYKK